MFLFKKLGLFTEAKKEQPIEDKLEDEEDKTVFFDNSVQALIIAKLNNKKLNLSDEIRKFLIEEINRKGGSSVDTYYKQLLNQLCDPKYMKSQRWIMNQMRSSSMTLSVITQTPTVKPAIQIAEINSEESESPFEEKVAFKARLRNSSSSLSS